MAVKFIDENGTAQTVELEGLKHHVEAKTSGRTFRQVVNAAYPTKAGDPDAFSQFCVSAGLRFKADDALGTPVSNLQSILKPEAGSNQTGGSYTAAPGTPDSTILFVPALLETVEASMRKNTGAAVAAFDSLVTDRVTIPGKEFKQAIVNYGGKKGPEDFEWKRSTQNADPDIMLSITAADVSRNVPTYSMGMEVSAEAMLISGVDILADPLEKFFIEAAYNDWVANIGLILSGDPDGVTSDMDDNTAAVASATAKSYDSSITVAGTLTQAAWVQFLYHNSMYMTKSVMTMDINALLAVDGRVGRPDRQLGEIDRIDVPFKVIYPAFNTTVDIIVMPEGTFPANTILAIDRNWGLKQVTSAFADYQAVEDMILRRSTVVRVDRGSLVYRKYTKAFDVMTLTV